MAERGFDGAVEIEMSARVRSGVIAVELGMVLGAESVFAG
jgi:hypothetical protein